MSLRKWETVYPGTNPEVGFMNHIVCEHLCNLGTFSLISYCLIELHGNYTGRTPKCVKVSHYRASTTTLGVVILSHYCCSDECKRFSFAFSCPLLKFGIFSCLLANQASLYTNRLPFTLPIYLLGYQSVRWLSDYESYSFIFCIKYLQIPPPILSLRLKFLLSLDIQKVPILHPTAPHTVCYNICQPFVFFQSLCFWLYLHITKMLSNTFS